ncbi:unnamed protein product, partial [Angiostrongylus costaricensis]|uniref:Copine domain-containing protein n=1 Tax=Angiostrongylus costaricensis TaxID=334426 RepID=A0A158PJK1_ANGCS
TPIYRFRFWFGEQRRSLCQGRNADPVDCFGPPQLSAFHSVGSRLFRVRTYHAAYLRNLRIFPRVIFRAHSGQYRACDHEFRAGNGSLQIIEADPDMAPVAPFFIRSKPEITWHGLHYNEEFTIAIIDVLHNYEPSENFRPEPNPMVVVVFGTSNMALKLDSPDDFDISKFMLENDLADDLIGLSLVIVGSDAFAIERQRLRGNIDNCHSLLRSSKLSTFVVLYKENHCM